MAYAFFLSKIFWYFINFYKIQILTAKNSSS